MLDKRQQRRVYQDLEGGGSFEAEQPAAAEKRAYGMPPRGEKTETIDKLKQQNDKLKGELRMLTVKLEEFVEKAKQRKTEKASSLIRQSEQDDVIREKE